MIKVYINIIQYSIFNIFIKKNKILWMNYKIWMSMDHKIWMSMDHKIWMSMDHKIWMSMDHKIWMSMDHKICIYISYICTRIN